MEENPFHIRELFFLSCENSENEINNIAFESLLSLLNNIKIEQNIKQYLKENIHKIIDVHKRKV